MRLLERVQDVDGRDEPGHDGGDVCSSFVLDNRPKLSYRVSLDLFLRGARSRGVAVWEQARSRRRARTPVIAGGRSWHASRSAETNRARRAVWLLHLPQPSSRAAQRATLDQPSGSQHPLRAHRCWLFDKLINSVIPDEAQRRSGIVRPAQHCHPGAAQQSPGSRTTTVQNEARRCSRSSAPVVVLDPRLRGDDTGEDQAPHSGLPEAIECQELD